MLLHISIRMRYTLCEIFNLWFKQSGKLVGYRGENIFELMCSFGMRLFHSSNRELDIKGVLIIILGLCQSNLYDLGGKLIFLTICFFSILYLYFLLFPTHLLETNRYDDYKWALQVVPFTPLSSVHWNILHTLIQQLKPFMIWLLIIVLRSLLQPALNIHLIHIKLLKVAFW